MPILQLLRQITDDFPKTKTDEHRAVNKRFFLVYVCKVRKLLGKFIDMCNVFQNWKTGVHLKCEEYGHRKLHFAYVFEN